MPVQVAVEPVSVETVQGTEPVLSGRPQVGSSWLATLVGDVEGDALAFVQGRHPGGLHGGHMNENILRAVGRLNEPEALLGVKPLDCSGRH